VLAAAWYARLVIPLVECVQWSLCIAYHFVFVSISYVGILRFVEGVRLLLQHGTTNSTTDDRNGDSSEATQQQNSSTLAWSAAVRVLAQLKQMACSAEVSNRLHQTAMSTIYLDGFVCYHTFSCAVTDIATQRLAE
jgi:hypothetical protein